MRRPVRPACLLLGTVLLALAWASAAKAACPASKQDISLAVDRTDLNVSLGSQAMTKVLPAGNSIDILVDVAFADKLIFAGLIEWTGERNGATAMYVPPNAIWSHELLSNDAFLAGGQNGFAPGKTLLSFQLPGAFQSLGREVTVTLSGCTKGSADQPTVARIQARTSSFWPCLLIAVFSVLAAYLIAVLAASTQRKVPLQATLSPLRLTAGWDRRGSPAKMQVMLFTLIVIGLLTFIMCRAGFLSNMSTDIMTLLGISTGGAVIARATDIQKNRISPDNRSWLETNGLLDQAAIDRLRQPRWSDLFMIGDEFDVSRLQIMLFSLLIGATLIRIGYYDLATFSVPNSLLQLLGISQGTYILAKATSPNNAAALDQSVAKVRAAAEARQDTAKPVVATQDAATNGLVAGVAPSQAAAAPGAPGVVPAASTYDEAVRNMANLFRQVYRVAMLPAETETRKPSP